MKEVNNIIYERKTSLKKNPAISGMYLFVRDTKNWLTVEQLEFIAKTNIIDWWSIEDWVDYFVGTDWLASDDEDFKIFFGGSMPDIDSDHEISQVPPFYRQKKKTIAVLGAENLCWLMSETDDVGQCTNRNCRSSVHFYARKPIGYVFFFDIDEREDIDKVLNFLDETAIEFGVSHFILTETTKGFHVWSADIKPHKAGWNEVFQRFKKRFESDYEYMSQWILRLGAKKRNPSPRYIGSGIYSDHHETEVSLSHLLLLQRYAGLPDSILNLIIQSTRPVNTFSRQVIYHSWKIEENDESVKAHKWNGLSYEEV